MRKYILSIFFIIIGCFGIFYSMYTGGKNTYSEAIFGHEVSNFESALDEFLMRTKQDIDSLQHRIRIGYNAKDTLETRNYLLDLLRNRPSLTSIGIFQNNFKLVSRKDNNSLIYAIDTLEPSTVVRWQRFENEKLVSSWLESLDVSLQNSSWFATVSQTSGSMLWFNGEIAGEEIDNKDRKDFIYTGYTYEIDGEKSVLILEFSKDVIWKSLGFTSIPLPPQLRIRTSDNRELVLKAKEVGQVDNDSLNLALDSHYQKFDTIQHGNFNFNYRGQTYWNAFKRFPKETGLNYYLLTIDAESLENLNPDTRNRIILWLGIGFIILGLILLAVRKRFFYRPNRMEIPTLAELLTSDENRYLEFKSSLRWDYRQEKQNPELEKVILKTLAAFGNTDGGILLIGVDDDKNILGLDKDFGLLKKQDADYFEVHLRNILHKEMGVKYVSKYIRTEFEALEDDKLVCKIRVISASEPLFLKFRNKSGQVEEVFYVRSGNSSHEIKSFAEINDYISKKYKN